ncbi:YkgJ family cysteine cluster protein [Vulcanisaeta thermophila]|uniref:YkgJ family cysteine cluster protein n=1 Tax=Vulcanisaeta thermophila TaxID=867917 RepID=UPI00085298B1|nr:YkgJ family cysteine cluster protein [Vulcanisaeta thermophila]
MVKIRVRLGGVFDDEEFFNVKMKCTKCGRCCFNTEMELLPEDVERLVRLGYPIEYFATVVNGVVRLRNVNGHCVFLNENTMECTVYENRPIGCRIYPVVYDDVEGPYIDRECPAWDTVDKGELKRLGGYLPLFVSRSRMTLDWVRLRYGYPRR